MITTIGGFKAHSFHFLFLNGAASLHSTRLRFTHKFTKFPQGLQINDFPKIKFTRFVWHFYLVDSIRLSVRPVLKTIDTLQRSNRNWNFFQLISANRRHRTHSSTHSIQPNRSTRVEFPTKWLKRVKEFFAYFKMFSQEKCPTFFSYCFRFFNLLKLKFCFPSTEKEHFKQTVALLEFS